MSIEIKQLLIKSNIVQKEEKSNSSSLEEQYNQKEELLAECRRLIYEILRERGER